MSTLRNEMERILTKDGFSSFREGMEELVQCAEAGKAEAREDTVRLDWLLGEIPMQQLLNILHPHWDGTKSWRDCIDAAIEADGVLPEPWSQK